MVVSDASRLRLHEQARADWGEEAAEVLMEVVGTAGQDMATRADRGGRQHDGGALAPLHLGMLGHSFTS